ncbi:MAG: pentapeptide repeat-containing protein [Spirulina sp. SIO3F2]|nr:pentapeptide repeat-containing protein [Spirulina sp. SIO3F2]
MKRLTAFANPLTSRFSRCATIGLASLLLATAATPSLAYDADDLETLRNKEHCFSCDLTDAPLSGWDLSQLLISESDLSGANLSGTDLSGTWLFRTDLSGADLSGADLDNTVLTRVDLSGANLSGADLSSADILSGSTLTGATYDQYTLFPDDFDYSALTYVGTTEVTADGSGSGGSGTGGGIIIADDSDDDVSVPEPATTLALLCVGAFVFKTIKRQKT